MKRLHLMYWIITIGTLLSGLILVLALSPPANASGCEHGCTPTTTYIVNKDDTAENVAKGIVIGALLVCGTRSVWTRIDEKRWTLCGERPKPAPLPNPGPAVNDVTPDPQPNRIIFK